MHIASVWVPFTSESKEAIAHYEDIIKEVKLALQEAGRALSSYIRKKQRVGLELRKRSFIEKYIPKLAEAVAGILELGVAEQEQLAAHLSTILERTRGVVEDMSFDPSKNLEYDEEWARIGREDNDTNE